MTDSSPEPNSPSAWQPVTCGVLALLIFLHLIAVTRIAPPRTIFELHPILAADYTEHAYHLDLYRRALFQTGCPWGYDPAIGAGTPLLPTQDAGSKYPEMLGVLLPFCNAQVVMRIALLFTAITFPLWSWWAVRLLDLPKDGRLWALLVLLSGVWLYPTMNGFMRVGMLSFALASFLTPLALATFIAYLNAPTTKRYLAFFMSASAVFLSHVLGVVIFLPTLACCAIFSKPLTRRQRTLLLSTPLLMLLAHAFWLIPFLVSMRTPLPPGREFGYHPRDLVYANLGRLLETLSIPKIAVGTLALGLSVYGLVVLWKTAGRRGALIIGSTLATGLAMKLFGSFVPVIETMNPVRFLLPVVVLASIPLGLACWAIANRLRLATPIGVPLAAVALLLVAVFAPRESAELSEEKFFGGQQRPRPISFPLHLPGSVPRLRTYEPLFAFIAERTKPDERLLIQTLSQSEQLVVPLLTGRETIGSAYPAVNDPIQFHFDRLFDVKIEDWHPKLLREALQRWGVNWVFTCSPKAEEVFSRITGEAGEPVGRHRVFYFSADASRFVKGSGKVVASVNRMHLSDVTPDENGIVVLRYRYHPAWHCEDPATLIYAWPVPEDPVGFIALRYPPEDCELKFSAVKALTSTWPADMGPVLTSQNAPEADKDSSARDQDVSK